MTVKAIETARLRLRGWNDDDVEAWARMNADPRVMEFFLAPTPLDESRDQAQRLSTELERHGYGWFVLEEKERPGFAGVIAVTEVRWDSPFQPKREVGWRLPVHAWGRGLATDGAAAALDFAAKVLDWPELVAFTAVPNVRSQRVMERLGMTHDPRDDFDHPRIPEGHPLRRHVLYRKQLQTH